MRIRITRDAMLSGSRWVAVIALGLLISGQAQAQQKFFRIGSGFTGTYPVMGAKLAEMINKHLPDVRATAVPGTTEANLVKINKGEMEAVFAYTFDTALVAAGKGDLAKTPQTELRHAIGLYGSYYFVVMKRDAPIQTLAELKSKPYRMWMGPKGSVMWTLNTAALSAYGVSTDDVSKVGGVVNTMSYQNVAQAFQDGQLDVIYFGGPASYSPLLQLDRTSGFRLMAFDANAGKRFMELLPGVSMGAIKAGTYQNQKDEVRTPYLFNQLVVGTKTPDDVIYRLVKMMIEEHKVFHGLFPGSEEILPQNALAHNRIKIHPGAEKYYREVGVLK